MMTRRLAALALATALLAAAPGSALAQEQPAADQTTERALTQEQRTDLTAEWVEKLKARALEAIEKRLVTLSELEGAISGADSLTDDHATTLLAEVRTSATGLTALAQDIEAAVDLDTLRVLVPMIFEDYRIYAVVVPKVHLAIGADAAAAVATRLTEVTVSIEDMLNRIEDAGFDVTEGFRLLDSMAASVESGAAQAAQVAPMVIGLTPADYPGSTELFRSAHDTLKGAGSDLRMAGETAHEIGRFIKALFGGDED